MTNAHYERLSAQDNSFLLFETHDVHMHVASTLIFEAGPLRAASGGIDVDAVRNTLLAAIHQIPRYHQRLQWIPLEKHAVWVDDPHFDIDYHIRHTALPKPGNAAQLKKLSSRVMAQPLDRKRPLWETWVVEGLEKGEAFALVTKIHHCMIDGASGVDLAQMLLSPSPEIPEPVATAAFVPRQAPSDAQLLRDEAVRRASLPARALRGLQEFIDEAEDLREEISVRAEALLRTLSTGLSADPTPMNGKVGPHRAFDWLAVPLDDLKAVRRAWGCTINDVVLTVVTGAVRDYLLERGANPAEIDFRVAAPVSVRGEQERGQLGNRVSSWILSLPIWESDARRQFEAVHRETRSLKRNRQALGVEMMMKIAEWTPSTLLSLGARALSGPTHSIVTNVPGPQQPLYCHGARLRALYPLVPLLENMGLGIALISYAGTVCWGFNADPELVPDVASFVEKIRASLRRVREASGTIRGEPARAPAVPAMPRGENELTLQ